MRLLRLQALQHGALEVAGLGVGEDLRVVDEAPGLLASPRPHRVTDRAVATLSLIRELAGEDLYSPGQALAPPNSRITAQKDAGGSEEVFENGDDGSEPTSTAAEPTWRTK